METLKVATLIEALAFVGRTYRNKDGSQPAEPVRKVIAQFDGAEDVTLGEWAEAKQSQPRSKPARPKPEAANLDEVLAQLQQAGTHAALRESIARLALSAADWKALARKVTGRSAKSGKAARETVETFLSDRLLLDERVESVKRQFRSATPSDELA